MGFSSDGRGLDDGGCAASGGAAQVETQTAERLAPYVVRYRGRALAALVALVVAALTTLIVPVAVRRMIDFGFSDRALQLIDSYFAVMIGVVAVLAISSAMRYYLVTTLGERIVADLRSRCLRAPHTIVVCILRYGPYWRNRFAADSRHDADQIGGRRLGVDRFAQSAVVPRVARP